jgi:hypothetical protein
MADAAALLRWLGAFLVTAGLPGWLLIGRHAHRLDWPSRVYLALGGGLLAAPLWGHLLTATGLPFGPVGYLATLLPVAFVLGRNRRWSRAVASLTDDLEPLDWRGILAVVALSAAMAAVLLSGFRDYAAPNHLDDASNHAFLVKRILDTQSLAAADIFAVPFGSPPAPYLVGWHASAALAASLAAIPGWLSAWYLPFLACALIPIPLSLFWRACRLPQCIVLLGGAFAVANYYTPANIFSWGGFGAIIGLFLVPWLVLALRAALRGGGFAASLMAGLAIVAVIHIHSSEFPTALILLIAVLPDPSGSAPDAHVGPPVRRAAAAVLVITVVVVAAGLLPLLGVLRAYREWTLSAPLPTQEGLRTALRQFLTFAGGNIPVLHWFVVPGIVAGLIWRRGRRLAWLSLAFFVFYLGVREFQDPVSLTLGRIYYRLYPRLIHPQIFLLPSLMASAVIGVLWLGGRVWRLPGRSLFAFAALVVLVHFVLYPGSYWSYRNLEFQQQFVPFSKEDAELARRMKRELGDGAVVANQYGDGSYWAMQVSGLRFLDPCSWPLGRRENRCLRPVISQLLQWPWGEQVRALQDLGTGYVYVGDKVLEGARPSLTRGRLDEDPRFVKLMDNGNAAVYRIRWDANGGS